MCEIPPFLGFGLGLRTEHYNAILDTKPHVDWFEALSENYMIPGGKPLDFLDKIRANYPIVMHAPVRGVPVFKFREPRAQPFR